jgi:hypothetical protein
MAAVCACAAVEWAGTSPWRGLGKGGVVAVVGDFVDSEEARLVRLRRREELEAFLSVVNLELGITCQAAQVPPRAG